MPLPLSTPPSLPLTTWPFNVVREGGYRTKTEAFGEGSENYWVHSKPTQAQEPRKMCLNHHAEIFEGPESQPGSRYLKCLICGAVTLRGGTP